MCAPQCPPAECLYFCFWLIAEFNGVRRIAISTVYSCPKHVFHQIVRDKFHGDLSHNKQNPAIP